MPLSRAANDPRTEGHSRPVPRCVRYPRNPSNVVRGARERSLDCDRVILQLVAAMMKGFAKAVGGGRVPLFRSGASRVIPLLECSVIVDCPCQKFRVCKPSGVGASLNQIPVE
jgi:hypothetical protein